MAQSDLEARVAALEAHIGELTEQAQAAREDAAAARHLAVANDRDVAELRTEIRDFRQATTGSFNAMRDDLVDLRSELRSEFVDVRNEMRSELADVRNEVRTGFAEVRGKLDGTAAGLEQITGLLNQLIGEQGGPEQ